MRILFLQDDFPPESFGGAGISTFEIAMAMKKAGHEIFVITTCRKESEAGESDFAGLKIFKIASNYQARWRAYISLYNSSAVKKVEAILRKIKPDVVHVNNVHFHLSYHSIKIAKQHAKLVTFTARDVLTFNFAKLTTRRYMENLDASTSWLDHLKQARLRWNPPRNFVIKKYLSYADKIFAVSHALLKALEQNGIKNVEVLQTGIDFSLWTINEEKIFEFRKSHDLENKKVILFGGRLSEAKGGEKMIEALEIIVKEVPNAVLLVAGQIDWYAEKMKEKAEELTIGQRLIFSGWLSGDELKAAFGVSDVVCVPSICFDSFPRVLLEAMAARKPVVATRYGGAPEIVVEGQTGYIVNPIYPEKIAEKVIDLLKNPQKAKGFGEVGYERIKSNFNLEKIVTETLAKFEELIS